MALIRSFLLKLVLEDAIRSEERAYRFYEQALEISSFSEVKRLLKKLCAAELKHRLNLERLLRRGEKGDYPLHDQVEMPAVSREAWVSISPAAGIREVLDIALANEITAQRYYSDLAQRILFKAVQDVLSFLADEEAQHVRWIERAVEEAIEGKHGGKD
jgi:rubrerythrin